MSITNNKWTVTSTDVDWKQLRCKNHPDRPAVIWINAPKGNTFCKECLRDFQRQIISNPW
jgi:hypothetical protein